MSEDKKDEPVDLSGFDAGTGDDVSADAIVAQLKADLEKAQRDYLYLRADFDNYKKSAIKERSELLKYGNERLLVEVLNLVDTFDQGLALEITSENFESFSKGMQLVRNEFQTMFGRLGVQKIESQGQPFDPNLHEAISSEPTDTVPAGHVSRVFKPPYKLHDKVIRAGQVVVAREPESNS